MGACYPFRRALAQVHDICQGEQWHVLLLTDPA
jgi:hypothetical protein